MLFEKANSFCLLRKFLRGKFCQYPHGKIIKYLRIVRLFNLIWMILNFISKHCIILSMIFFLLMISLIVNVASYYVHSRINYGLAKQLLIYDKYQKQKSILQGHLSTIVLNAEYNAKYNEDQIF